MKRYQTTEVDSPADASRLPRTGTRRRWQGTGWEFPMSAVRLHLAKHASCGLTLIDYEMGVCHTSAVGAGLVACV